MTSAKTSCVTVTGPSVSGCDLSRIAKRFVDLTPIVRLDTSVNLYHKTTVTKCGLQTLQVEYVTVTFCHIDIFKGELNAKTNLLLFVSIGIVD